MEFFANSYRLKFANYFRKKNSILDALQSSEYVPDSHGVFLKLSTGYDKKNCDLNLFWDNLSDYKWFKRL